MNWYSISLFLHVLAVVVWIGGVVFLDFLLVPSLKRAMPEIAPRARFLYRLFRNFFAIVWGMAGLLLVTGYGLIHLRGDTDALIAGNWGDALTGAQWSMVAGGHLMILLALYVFFFPFLRMRGAIRRENWEAACHQAGRIRLYSLANIVLAVPVIGSGIWAIFGGPVY